MPRSLGNRREQAHIHPVLRELIAQHAGSLAKQPGMPYGVARLRCGDGLVEPLAAAVHHEPLRGFCFARAQECIHRVYIIDVERAKVQNAHGKPPLHD